MWIAFWCIVGIFRWLYPLVLVLGMLSLVVAISLRLFWLPCVLLPVLSLQLSNCQISLAVHSSQQVFILANHWERSNLVISNLYVVLWNREYTQNMESWHGDCVLCCFPTHKRRMPYSNSFFLPPTLWLSVFYVM